MLEGGIFRRKGRRSRRPGFRREPAVLFYPRYAAETFRKALGYWRGFRREKSVIRRVLADPARFEYTDMSLQLAMAADFETFGLCRETMGGAAAVARKLSHESMVETSRAARLAVD